MKNKSKLIKDEQWYKYHKTKTWFQKTNEISNFWESKVEGVGKEQNIKEWIKVIVGI